MSSKSTMMAAVISEHGDIGRIHIEPEYPRPVVKPGWVLLKVRACSLNYHDIFTRRGMPGIRIPLPIITGSDVAGEIAETGAGVGGFSAGDRVLVDPMPNAHTEHKFIGEQFDGGRAEYCLAHESQLILLPDQVSFDIAASIPLAYATAHRMLATQGALKAGETILILGASGGVGTACVLIAKLMGAIVYACAGTDAKAERLRAIGADHVINYRESDMREAMWRLVGKPRISGNGGVDVVVNNSGGGTWIDSLRCLRLGGRMLVCGATGGYEEKVDVRYLWTFEHRIIGSDGWRREDILRLLKHARTGKLIPVIDRCMPLTDIQAAERALEKREVFGKIVIHP